MSDDSDLEDEYEENEDTIKPAQINEQVQSELVTDAQYNQREVENRTDISEDFLREIEDTGIRFQNTSLEERSCHILQPPEKYVAPSQPVQFVDVPLVLDDDSSSQSSIISNERVVCDICLKTWTKKGLTKHRNACLKKLTKNN